MWRYILSLSAAHVQACRALMIITLLLGLGAMIVSLLGMKCIKIGSATEQSKAKIAITGGVLSILSGESTEDPFKPLTPGFICIPLYLDYFLKGPQ